MANAEFPINGEVKNGASNISCWVKFENPETVITCKPPANISFSTDCNLCCRSTDCATVHNWNFQILAYGKSLQSVALLPNGNNSFFLQSVADANGMFGTTTGQMWWTQTLESSRENSKEYFVKIGFVANHYGTYRQDVIFSFGEYPIILKRLCMDCAPPEDAERLDNATSYQFSQNPKSQVIDSLQIQRFASPFVPQKDPKEDQLSNIYPYPDENNFSLTQETLTDTCLTPENYRGRLHELITIEELARHEQIARYDVIANMHLLPHYILNVLGDSSTIAKYTATGELFGQLPLNRNISEDTKSGRLFLRSCNTVLFKCFGMDNSSASVYEAYIEDKCTQTVYIRLSKECVSDLNLYADMDVLVQVHFVMNRLPFCEWHRAVDSLPDLGLVFLNKAQSELKMDNIIQQFDSNVNTSDEEWNWLLLDMVLNAEQKRAVSIMTAPADISMPPLLLLGPYGTGKTYTIAETLCLLLMKSSEHKILLCTHSNSAADLYVKEFFDGWYKTRKCPRLKPLRIYYKGRAKNTVHPVVLEYSLMNDNGTFRDPTKEDLKECNLIVTTLSTASSLTHLNIEFSYIVIDEAAQALECEVLIPLSMANPQTRLIFAGDQMQLAPEIYSNLASERGLGVSLLERIYTMYPQTHPCRIHLCQNYRSHKDIIKFTSEMFYGGIVSPGNNQLRQHPTLHPLTFYSVLGQEMQNDQSTGYVHPGEVFELVNRILELKYNWPTTRWGPYKEGSIGVLACYAEQVQMIRTKLREHKLSEVSVERVLNVQGKQFTAVFISTVRSMSCCKYPAERNVKDFGFLTNPRLLNTAITRAKCLVAVVGDPLALLTIGSCRNLWQRYLEVADLHGIDRETLNRHLETIPEVPKTTPLNPLAKEFVPRNQQNCSLEYVPVIMRYPYAPYRVSWD